MKKTFSVCLILVSIAFLLAANLGPDCLSQVIGTLTAGLEGTVTDVIGKPLAGVAVNYRNLERNLQGGTLTTARGQYRISYYPGPYLIEAKLKGFKRWVREGIILRDNETQQLEIVLEAEGSAPAVHLRPEDYVQPALASVRKNLEYMKKAVDQVQISVIGEPVVRPDRAAHLSRIDAKERVAIDVAPDALVLIKLYDGGQFRSPALVSFRDQQAEVTFYDTDPLRYPMDESEWSQIFKELELFYAAASEINHGPERFDPFLRNLLHASGEQSPLGLPGNELCKLIGLTADCYSLMNWLRFEGLEPDDSFLRRALTMQAIKNDPRKAADELAKGLEGWRDLLRKSGALEPDHLRSASAYMRRKLGEGLFYKESNSDHKYPGLSESATLYSALLIGRVGCHVHFSRIEGRFEIVGIERR
jgi:hypothetical protein